MTRPPELKDIEGEIEEIKTRKEKAIKLAMTGCLDERGYQVAGWAKTPKHKPVGAAPAPAK